MYVCVCDGVRCYWELMCLGDDVLGCLEESCVMFGEAFMFFLNCIYIVWEHFVWLCMYCWL